MDIAYSDDVHFEFLFNSNWIDNWIDGKSYL